MSTRRIGGIIDLSLQWRQSERHSVPNHWRLVCLLNRVFQALIKENTSLAFVRAIYRWLVDSPHKGPVIRKMFPFCYIIMPEISGMSRTMPLLMISCRARTQDICNPGVDYTGKRRACLPCVQVLLPSQCRGMVQNATIPLCLLLIWLLPHYAFQCGELKKHTAAYFFSGRRLPGSTWNYILIKNTHNIIDFVDG